MMEGAFRMSHGIASALSWETSGRLVATGRGVVVVVEERLVVGLAVGFLVVVVRRVVLAGVLVVEDRLVGRTVLDGTVVVGRFVVVAGREVVEDRLVVGRAVVERGAGFLLVFLVDGFRVVGFLVVDGRFVTGF